MTNKPKAIGTKAETAVLRSFPPAAAPIRPALNGSADLGDIHAWGGAVVVEVKSRDHRATAGNIRAWLAELDAEWRAAQKSGAPVDFAVLVVKGPGVGLSRPRDWMSYCRPDDAVWLLTGLQVVDDDGWLAMPWGQVVDRLGVLFAMRAAREVLG